MNFQDLQASNIALGSGVNVGPVSTAVGILNTKARNIHAVEIQDRAQYRHVRTTTFSTTPRLRTLKEEIIVRRNRGIKNAEANAEEAAGVRRRRAGRKRTGIDLLTADLHEDDDDDDDNADEDIDATWDEMEDAHGGDSTAQRRQKRAMSARAVAGNCSWKWAPGGYLSKTPRDTWAALGLASISPKSSNKKCASATARRRGTEYALANHHHFYVPKPPVPNNGKIHPRPVRHTLSNYTPTDTPGPAASSVPVPRLGSGGTSSAAGSACLASRAARFFLPSTTGPDVGPGSYKTAEALCETERVPRGHTFDTTPSNHANTVARYGENLLRTARGSGPGSYNVTMKREVDVNAVRRKPVPPPPITTTPPPVPEKRCKRRVYKPRLVAGLERAERAMMKQQAQWKLQQEAKEEAERLKELRKRSMAYATHNTNNSNNHHQHSANIGLQIPVTTM